MRRSGRTHGRIVRARRARFQHRIDTGCNLVGSNNSYNRWLRRPLSRNSGWSGGSNGSHDLGHRTIRVARGFARLFLFEQQEEQKIDPQLKEINDRLERIEGLPSDHDADRRTAR